MSGREPGMDLNLRGDYPQMFPNPKGGWTVVHDEIPITLPKDQSPYSEQLGETLKAMAKLSQEHWEKKWTDTLLGHVSLSAQAWRDHMDQLARAKAEAGQMKDLLALAEASERRQVDLACDARQEVARVKADLAMSQHALRRTYDDLCEVNRLRGEAEDMAAFWQKAHKDDCAALLDQLHVTVDQVEALNRQNGKLADRVRDWERTHEKRCQDLALSYHSVLRGVETRHKVDRVSTALLGAALALLTIGVSGWAFSSISRREAESRLVDQTWQSYRVR